MLNALGYPEAALFLDEKVKELLHRGQVTADLRRSLDQDTQGALSTAEVGDACRFDQSSSLRTWML